MTGIDIQALDDDLARRMRRELVDSLVDDGTIRSSRVESAFRSVPRHQFAPEASLADAYARYSVIVKTDDDGRPISTVSDPHIQAVMLEQAEIQAGMRVLEIGSGGYNAALLAELTGPLGSVTTVDLDPEVTARASSFLMAAGYPRVTVVLADAAEGLPTAGPFDRIMVTAGAWDIPPVWTAQLAGDGRIVVPLRTRGVTRTVALDARAGRLVSSSSAPCGFVPMQGAGMHRERAYPLDGGRVIVTVDDGELEDPEGLSDVLAGERDEAWSGVLIGRAEPFGHLHLSFATSLPGFVRLQTSGGPADPDLVRSGEKFFPFGNVEARSLAYMTVRPAADDRVEIGARAFGPHAGKAAGSMAEAVRAWDRHHRHGDGPVYTVLPAGTRDGQLPDGHVIDKRHSRIVISWPSARCPN
jgi:protein-L-isoaspartate(D-aspartate) O-methyltransferase